MLARSLRLTCLALACALAFPVLADKPDWAGHGKGKHGREERHDDRRYDDRYDSRYDDRGGAAYRFDDAARRVIFDYYGQEADRGRCPPGLAKKNNGCQPPGQARKWQRGRALPSDIGYHDLPREILRRLPPPPPQHRYVQVAGDILMIAVGSRMVVDAVEDILR